MPERTFAEVERDLEETLSKLKETQDQNERQQLLLRMRLFLAEADHNVLEPRK